MSRSRLWLVAKALEGLGLLVVLVGVVGSIGLGLGEQGLESMKLEFQALFLGGGLFLVGWLIERRVGLR